MDSMHDSVQEIYDTWANPLSFWSGWIKPVLFAHLDKQDNDFKLQSLKFFLEGIDVSWAPVKGKNIAVIIDLQGAHSLQVGLSLAYKGYQPIPMYNCAPDLHGVVDMREVMNWLANGHRILKELQLPYDGPPAFILDSMRLQGGKPSPGRYDNRWVVLPQDFPSAAMLSQNKIQSVLVLQEHQNQPADDLRHVLKRWQDSGIEISVTSIAKPSDIQRIQITRPSNYRSIFYKALVLFGLRRNSTGGFGALVPEPSSSGGGFS